MPRRTEKETATLSKRVQRLVAYVRKKTTTTPAACKKALKIEGHAYKVIVATAISQGWIARTGHGGGVKYTAR